MAEIFNFPKGNGVGSTTNAAGSPTLGLGSRGLAVQEIQARLQQLHFDVSADGIYGQSTLVAVKSFQSSNGLTADGVVGIATWRKLEMQTVDPLPTRDAQFEPETVTGEYHPVSRPGVTQGGAAALQSGTLFGRPLWQWGLFVLGGAAVLYLLAKHEDGGSVAGYRRLLTDASPKSKASRMTVDGKCSRVPGSDKLKDAEELEAA